MAEKFESPVKALTSWFKKNQRPLPWRLTQDPYSIWVSEVMLQQTQVATVIPYYTRFLKAFPDLISLAKAPEDQVLQKWAGLGYYSRARNLHKGARYLLEVHQGEFPRTQAEILKVPGIGPYTAGAVLSIAFNLQGALVDGNVERVLSRYYGYQKPIDTPKAKRFFWAKAKDLVSQSSEPKLFNQGLMELGSLICTKASPQCLHCPLKESCQAFKLEVVHKIPTKKTKKAYVHLLQVKFVFEKEGKWWLRKNGDKEWWKGLWDFHTEDLPQKKDWTIEIEKAVKRYKPTSWKELTHIKHTVTHHKLQVIPVHLKVRSLPPMEGKWVRPKTLGQLPLSALVQKIIVHDFKPPC